MSNCVICAAVTRVVTARVIFNYSSSRYFIFPVANFHFRLQFLQSLMNCWNLRKLGASRFHLQLASLEIDLFIYLQQRVATQPAALLKPVHSGNTVLSMQRQVLNY